MPPKILLLFQKGVWPVEEINRHPGRLQERANDKHQASSKQIGNNSWMEHQNTNREQQEQQQQQQQQKQQQQQQQLQELNREGGGGRGDVEGMGNGEEEGKEGEKEENEGRRRKKRCSICALAVLIPVSKTGKVARTQSPFSFYTAPLPVCRKPHFFFPSIFCNCRSSTITNSNCTSSFQCINFCTVNCSCVCMSAYVCMSA